MPKAVSKPIKVSVDIKPGATSQAQKQAWKRFWQRLFAEVKANER
ncbi:hypothetical protein ACFLW9_02470 [Chloroflexota bacterium]